MSHDTPAPYAAAAAEQVELFHLIGESLRGGSVPRALLHRIAQVEPQVAAARSEAIAAGMHPADWACWYVDEIQALYQGISGAPSPDTLRRTALATAHVVLRG